MNQPPVYLCLPFPAVGGAEKRMAGLWRYLLQRSDRPVYLVLPQQAWEILRSLPELAPLDERFTVRFDAGGGHWRPALRNTVQQIHRNHPDAVFHLVMVAPWEVRPLATPRLLFTVPISGMGILNLKGQLGVMLGAALATRVDCLEEKVHAQLCRWLRWKRGGISVTPSSFIDLDFFRPHQEKTNRLVFSGLFSPEKQILRLLNCIPTIDRCLRAAGIADPEFCLLGRETEGTRVADLCRQLAPDILVTTGFEPEPSRILAQASVIFSLQKQTNYPSKSLLEGMACGCVPVITDTGNSERIVPRALGCYLPRDFAPEEIAQACLDAFQIQRTKGRQHGELMRNFLAERFSLQTMADYYSHHYQQLGYLTGH